MKSCAGITQHVEMAEQYIGKTFEPQKGLVFVGPFHTAKEAARWLSFMVVQRSGACEVDLPGYCIDSSPWYGVIFQSAKELDGFEPMEEQFPVLNGH